MSAALSEWHWRAYTTCSGPRRFGRSIYRDIQKCQGSEWIPRGSQCALSVRSPSRICYTGTFPDFHPQLSSQHIVPGNFYRCLKWLQIIVNFRKNSDVCPATDYFIIWDYHAYEHWPCWEAPNFPDVLGWWEVFCLPLLPSIPTMLVS